MNFDKTTSGRVTTKRIQEQATDLYRLRQTQDAMSTFVCQVKPKSDVSEQPFEAVLLLNKDRKKSAPTVLFLHGGPHSAFPIVYILSNAYLTALGYNVLQVNYR